MRAATAVKPQKSDNSRYLKPRDKRETVLQNYAMRQSADLTQLFRQVFRENSAEWPVDGCICSSVAITANMTRKGSFLTGRVSYVAGGLFDHYPELQQPLEALLAAAQQAMDDMIARAYQGEVLPAPSADVRRRVYGGGIMPEPPTDIKTGGKASAIAQDAVTQIANYLKAVAEYEGVCAAL
jgi:hypothetical protein